MKPIIGITTKIKQKENEEYVSLKYSYIKAVKLAGGIPIAIPNNLLKDDVKKYVDIVDGLILTGGEDISPLLYNENPIKEVTKISHERDETELLLLEETYKRNKPILGICRGMQLINVYLDGTLYQDIHKQKENVLGHVSLSTLKKGYHNVNLTKDTFLYEAFKKDKIIVNSNHHQAIKKLGKGLKVSALSDDGMIEAIEGKNINAFQFHPEEMIEDKLILNIFINFINKCGVKDE